MRTVLVLCVVLAAAVGAQAGELAGVTMGDTTEVGDQQLVLNGMGLRKKAIIKVYVAGLYLPTKQNDAEKILASDTARQLVMDFRFGVSGKKMCGAWDECLEANVANASDQVKADFERLCGYMDDMEKGEKMIFTYLPGEGTESTVKGQSKGTIAGRPFADALYSCWIGANPPGAAFKKGLLGE
ncbi:MAG: chalcone isomerase family protein [Thermoanaerobaculia bacterium]